MKILKCSIALIICLIFYLRFMKTGSVTDKIIPTAAAALLSCCGGFGYINAGLIICIAADALLSYKLIPGVIAFAAAHICFMVGFCSIHNPSVNELSVFLVLSLILCAVIFHASTSNRLVFCVYAVVLALMVSLSLHCGMLLALGAVLFAFSDTLIGIRMLYGVRSGWNGYISMGTYYTALYLFALSRIL